MNAPGSGEQPVLLRGSMDTQGDPIYRPTDWYLSTAAVQPTHIALHLSAAAQQARRRALTTIADGIFEDWEVDLIFAALGLGESP